MFSDYKYEDIREQGKALVDRVWQIRKIPDGDPAGDFIGQIAEHAIGLQTALPTRAS